jgi:hypothetical protein
MPTEHTETTTRQPRPAHIHHKENITNKAAQHAD